MTRWWRAYDDAINDPKLLRLSDEMFRAWFTLLCIASKNGGKLPPAEDIALTLRMKPTKVAEWITKLSKATLLDSKDGTFVPHNWDSRQFQSDNSTARVKRYREGKRNVSGNVTRNVTPNVSDAVTETAPEQSRAETESEQSRADTAPPPVDEDLKRRAQALGAAVSAHFLSRNLRIPDLGRCLAWLQQGYAQGTILATVERVLARGKAVTSLEYFDGALKDDHAKAQSVPALEPVPLSDSDWGPIVRRFKANRSMWSRHAGPEPGMAGCRCPVQVLVDFQIDPASGQDIGVGWSFVGEQTPEMAAWIHDAQARKAKAPWVYEVVTDGVEKRGFFSMRRVPPGYDEATGEKLAQSKSEENAA